MQLNQVDMLPKSALILMGEENIQCKVNAFLKKLDLRTQVY